MKKNNSMTKKLVSASAMLAVSAAMLAASTYAWFTMNKEVEVTGMELRTKVGANLLICSDNVEANYSSEDLLQGRKGLLEPVSSINGATGTFYYTVNATARGTKESGATITGYNENTAVANTTAGKVAYDTLFNRFYGVKTSGTFSDSDIAMTSGTDGAAYGYIDYVFYVKATADADNQDLNMTECNLLYNGAAVNSSGTAGVNIDRAWRVGVFAVDITNNGGKGYDAVKTIDPAIAGNQKAILGLQGASYFKDTKAQASETQLGDVTNFKNGTGDGVVLDTINNKGKTNYYKVLVRVWLEGEDDTCNSQTYAALQDGRWKLNCKFELGTGSPINVLNSNAANVASGATQTAVNNDDVAKSGS